MQSQSISVPALEKETKVPNPRVLVNKSLRETYP